MVREYHRWASRHLGREMELLTFGHAGLPVVVFPTSMGAFFDYEDRGMVAAVADKIDAGMLRLICVATLDSETFYARQAPPRARIDRYLSYERYLVEELVPWLQRVTRWTAMGVTGCSFGGYHALTMALRHPDVFTECITMGAAFDITRFFEGYYDEDVYLLCPPHFLPGLDNNWFLDRMRRNKWVLVTGDADICRAETEQAAGLLGFRDVPHSLHVWGNGSAHDWPEWIKMAKAYLP
jgi:esterase/lipase superfamily enzyme